MTTHRDPALCTACDHPRHDGTMHGAAHPCTFGQANHCPLDQRGFTFSMDYAEGFMLALEADKASKAHREAADTLAGDPDTAERFAGAIRNFNYMSGVYADLALRLRATIGTDYKPE